MSSAFLVLLFGFLGDMIGRRNSPHHMSSLSMITMAFSTTRDKVLLFVTSVFGASTGRPAAVLEAVP